MVIHKCDRCGAEMVRWIILKTKIGATNEYANVADLIPLNAEKELCKECMDIILNAMVKEDEQK